MKKRILSIGLVLMLLTGSASAAVLTDAPGTPTQDRAVALEARHLAVVLDANDELAAGGVRERAYMFGDFLVILAGAFAIEVLALLHRGKESDVVRRYGLLHMRLLHR